MKNNLIFSRLAKNMYKNTKRVLRDFIYSELEIDQDIEFGNVHRFGRQRNGNSRPIVVRFLYYKELALVRDRAYLLKGKP